MPALRTEITEIVTGLGMLDLPHVEAALDHRPGEMINVKITHWERLQEAYRSGDFAGDFTGAWNNGRRFLESADGLRGRLPLSIEWKGPHSAPGYDFLPADLRVDHVFLVSCKYLSRILVNSSPSNLFLRRLADRTEGRSDEGWYEFVAPEAFSEFYAAVRRELIGARRLPPKPSLLTAEDIAAIRAECGGTWPESLRGGWRHFSDEVAQASTRLWDEALSTPARREEMLWRMLRLNSGPYFVLGASPLGHLRLRIATPWDWRQRYRLQSFDVRPAQAGQPKVVWEAHVLDREVAAPTSIEGHVEIRWSHGRFSGVEAKVYLDTDHQDVPGYFPLT